jgi:predicted dehydrogenase
MKKQRAAIVGLGFGAEFIPIYQNHPDAEMYAVCQRDPKRLAAIGKSFGITKCYTDYADLLRDRDVDFVHINTPIPDHARMTLMALEAGKHVACTVPMATSVEDCRRIVEACERTGRKYMMMETVVYSREFLFLQELLQKGALGKLQFLQASHQQDMDGWPGYWPGLPPMYYATHCVGPVLGLPRKDAEYVSCFGSGTIRHEMAGIYGSPFAVETAHVKLRHSDLSARIVRSLFDVARQYRESIDVYGTKQAFEWPLIEGEQAVLHTAKRAEHEIAERVAVPDFAHRLPAGIQKFTQKGVYDLAGNEHLSFTQGGGHGGSHPHLAHEFLRALVEDREPWPNARQSANWTCVGIHAHATAMAGGQRMELPSWTFSP